MSSLSWIVAGCASERAVASSSPPMVARGSGGASAVEAPVPQPRCVASAFASDRESTPKNLRPAASGSLAREPLRAVISSAQPRIARCWSEAMARDRALTDARVTMRFVIVSDGGVACAEAVASSVADEALSSCISRVMVALRFAPVARGPITVHYPFALTTTP